MFTGALISGGSMAASAREDAGQLGTTWPHAKDLSLAPGFHVYRFVHDEVKYIQINGPSGKVLAAVAASKGRFLRLPMGDAPLATPQQRSTITPAQDEPAVKVYDDGTTQITAKSDNNGAVSFLAADCAAGCTGQKQ